MRILFKILLFPVTLMLTVLVLFCQFVCLIGTTLLSILAFLIAVVALGILLFSGRPAEGFKYLIIAFCISRMAYQCLRLGFSAKQRHLMNS
ncbi:hypothetical protein [Lacrimispora sp.]|uniref:hypothetical protein n=1 Tax=Lacrimispora sp. TaxID=2719234 RepID=UPI003993DA3B